MNFYIIVNQGNGWGVIGQVFRNQHEAMVYASQNLKNTQYQILDENQIRQLQAGQQKPQQRTYQQQPQQRYSFKMFDWRRR